MTDGSPHHLPLKNVITWDPGLDDESVDDLCANITASRLMVSVCTRGYHFFAVWDWRIGEVIGAIGFQLVPTITHPTIAGPQVVQWSR